LRATGQRGKTENNKHKDAFYEIHANLLCSFSDSLAALISCRSLPDETGSLTATANLRLKVPIVRAQ
jgi:hypothetical protein